MVFHYVSHILNHDPRVRYLDEVFLKLKLVLFVCGLQVNPGSTKLRNVEPEIQNTGTENPKHWNRKPGT